MAASFALCGAPHLHLHGVRELPHHPPQALHHMSGPLLKEAMPLFPTWDHYSANWLLQLRFSVLISVVNPAATGSVLSRDSCEPYIPCMNGTSFLAQAPSLTTLPPTNQFQCVEGRGAVNTGKDRILGMQWLRPTEFRRKHFWKYRIIHLYYKILNSELLFIFSCVL